MRLAPPIILYKHYKLCLIGWFFYLFFFGGGMEILSEYVIFDGNFLQMYQPSNIDYRFRPFLF